MKLRPIDCGRPKGGVPRLGKDGMLRKIAEKTKEIIP